MAARLLRLSPGFSGFGFALLLIFCLGAPQPAAGKQISPPQPARPVPASTSLITAFTYLPLIMRDCSASLLDDFSNPASGWPIASGTHGSVAYDKGVYKITFNPDSADYNEGMGASPDWMVPNDAVISVDAWTSNVWGGAGLVFGLSCWEDTCDWNEWYVFSTFNDQSYYLDRWYADDFGGDYYVLAEGSSPAIKTDGRVHQSLEVRRNGSAMTLVANGVVLETVEDTDDPLTGNGSVGVFSYSDGTAIFDNFRVSASGCIGTLLGAQAANVRPASFTARNASRHSIWRLAPQIRDWRH
jgi:hypothetical protein